MNEIKEEITATIVGLLNLNCVELDSDVWKFAEQLIKTFEGINYEGWISQKLTEARIEELTRQKTRIEGMIMEHGKELSRKEKLTYSAVILSDLVRITELEAKK
jgi:hypothetical protein